MVVPVLWSLHEASVFLQTVQSTSYFLSLPPPSDYLMWWISTGCKNFDDLLIVKTIFFGIDTPVFKSTHSSQYYTERAKLRRKKKWINLSVGADILKQIICSIKRRRAPHARHDNVEFKPIITRPSEIKPLSVVVADKGCDSEENHVLVRDRWTSFHCYFLNTDYTTLIYELWCSVVAKYVK